MSTRHSGAFTYALEFVKLAEDQQDPAQPQQREFKPVRLSRTYSNKVLQRQVDPALQIGGTGKEGYTAEISDPLVEQAYRKILKQNGMVSPRNHLIYNTMLERARRSVYGADDQIR